jgi:HlyD family secretion protein
MACCARRRTWLILVELNCRIHPLVQPGVIVVPLRLAVFLVAVVALAGCGGKKAVKFRTAKLDRGPIESLVSATGTVRPVVQVEVGSQVSGTVYRLHADYNHRVKRGQVLCELDPSSLRARVVQAEAAMARNQAALKEAERQYRRAQELVAGNYISQAELEAEEVGVEQARADLQQAQAQLEAARVDLGHTIIRSPIDGVVIARTVDLGQTVAASLQAPQLFLIANDLADMQVETRIDEADIGVIQVGSEARFTVDAFPDDQFQGRVSEVRLEPIVEQGVVTYTTVIRTSNPQLKLRPGMTANVSVLVDQRDEVLLVPAAALRFRLPSEASGGASRSASAQSAGARTGAGSQAIASEGGRQRAADNSVVSGGDRTGAMAGHSKSGGRMGSPRTGSADTRQGDGRPGAAQMGAGEPTGPRLKPGVIYVLIDGKPQRVQVMTGITNGSHFEVVGEGLVAGSEVVVGFEGGPSNQNVQLPPGMGGPQFGGGGGGGGRSSGTRR